LVASLNANAFAMRIHLSNFGRIHLVNFGRIHLVNFRGGIEQNSQPTLIESEQH
jgi:hypothetical protein